MFPPDIFLPPMVGQVILLGTEHLLLLNVQHDLIEPIMQLLHRPFPLQLNSIWELIYKQLIILGT